MQASKPYKAWITGVLVLGGAISAATVAQAQGTPKVVFSEDFDAVVTGALPAGWAIALKGNGGDVSNLDGNSKARWRATDKAGAQDGSAFTASSGQFAYVLSDGIRPAGGAGYFDSQLVSRAIAVQPQVDYALSFSNFYRPGSTAVESGLVQVSYDGGAPQTLLTLKTDRRNQQEMVYFTPPAGAKEAKLIWEYNKAANNYYWGIDNVKVSEGVTAPVVTTPTLNVGPVLMNPGVDRMTVMVETSDAAPTLLYRVKGASAFIAVKMVQASKELADSKIFFAPLGGLPSNTVLEYKVQTGLTGALKETPVYGFKTWPRAGDVADGHQASFIAFSDTQDNNGGIFKGIVTKGIMATERCQAADPIGTCVENIKGVMVGGDFVGSGETRSQWKTQFFDNFSALSPYVPLIPALGNHEFFGSAAQGDSDADIAKWALTYRKYFAMVPLPATATRYPGHYYALDYLDARIFSVGSTPMTAMHNTGSWNELNYDFGRKLFNANFSREVQNWMDTSLQETDKKHLIMVSHQPCLTTTWRQAESVLVCDLVRKVESYAKKYDALAATLGGHSHAFDAGNSMDSRHLWFTIASASGGLESATGPDNSDLDIFRNTRLDFGYSELQMQFGSQARETWRRYSFDGTGKPTVLGDEISMSIAPNTVTPQLAQSNFGAMAVDAVQLRLSGVDAAAVYETQWQLSRRSDFGGEVFDVWGDETRRINLFFDAKGKTVDSRKDADPLLLNLGKLLSQPQRLYPFAGASNEHSSQYKRITAGADELSERWQCDRKWDERQCHARLEYDGKKASPLDPFDGKDVATLVLANGEQWYVRARVRDAELNWSGWTDPGSFYVGELPALPAQVQTLPADAAHRSLQLSVAPNSVCTKPLTAGRAAVGDKPVGHDLPYGAVQFTMGGCAVGVTAQVEVVAGDEVPANAQLLKLNSKTGQWLALPGAVRIGNSFRYSLEDGGVLDEDGLRDGNLTDPFAIAVPAVDVTPPVIPPVKPPASAQPVPALGGVAVVLTAAGLLLLGWRRQRWAR